MVLWILMLFSIFYCTARNWNDVESSGDYHFVTWLEWIWSCELQFCCGWSLHCVFWYDRLLLPLENGSVLVWSFGTLRLEWAHMLFKHWVQMGFSLSEVSCGGYQLTRLWMRCRVDPRGSVRLSCLGCRWTHPRRSPSSALLWSLTLPIYERQSWLLQDKFLAIFFLSPTQIACLWVKLVPCIGMQQIDRCNVGYSLEYCTRQQDIFFRTANSFHVRGDDIYTRSVQCSVLRRKNSFNWGNAYRRIWIEINGGNRSGGFENVI